MKIAELWAKRIVDGNKTYAEVPTQLKEEVATALEESGHANLAKTTTKKAALKKS